MLELLTRFVDAIETLAKNAKEQTEILRSRYGEPEANPDPVESAPPPQEEAPAPAPAKRTRKKAEKPVEAETAPPPVEPVVEPAPPVEPPVEPVTDKDLNAVLREISSRPELGGLVKAKELLFSHSGGKTRILETDPALYPAIYAACQEVINAGA